MDTGSGVRWKTVTREDEDNEVGEMRVRWEGECKLGGGNGDEVCNTGSIGWDDAEHDVCNLEREALCDVDS